MCKYYSGIIIITLFVWAFLSVLGSMFKASPDIKGCNKKYGIDHFLATNLFCEIKDEPR